MENYIVPDSDEELVSPDMFVNSIMDTELSTSSIAGITNSVSGFGATQGHIPQYILDHAQQAQSTLIPPASKAIYNRTYRKFKVFMCKNGMKDAPIDETVLLAYFQMIKRENGLDKNEKKKAGMAPSSMWAIYSMLKCTLSVYNKIDISNYHLVSAFLSSNKKQSDHVPQKAAILTEEEIAQFLETAPNNDWLAVKVACIVAVHGFCRQVELHKLKTQQVEDHGTYLYFNLVKTKNGNNRPFTLTGPLCHMVKKYMALRPTDYKEKSNFFLRYAAGKCHHAVIGEHKLAEFPKMIASYLGLENPKKYTGHTFRRSGATIGVEAGMDVLTLKKVGGWKSSTVAEGYYDTSKAQLMKNSLTISHAILKKMPPSSTITRPIPSHSSTAEDTVSPRHSTSAAGNTSPSPKSRKLETQSSGAPLAANPLNNLLLNNHPKVTDSHQVIHLNFNNCTGFNFFGTNDKENLR